MARAVMTRTVRLILTVDEATTLHQILKHVAGDTEGPRGDCDSICEALYASGAISSKPHRISGDLRIEAEDEI